MNIDRKSVEVITIRGVPALDLVTVILEDLNPGAGSLTIHCYGMAWSAYWGAMGSKRLGAFVASCEPEYVAEKLARPKDTKLLQAYLLRIVKSVQEALRLP